MLRCFSRVAYVSCTALSMIACSASTNETTVTPATYHRDIAPLMAQNCVSCHVSGGIAPFALDTYAAVKAHADAIKSEVQGRTMPPWPIVSDGSCGSFENSRALEDQEIAIISAWINAKMPEGNPSDAHATQVTSLPSLAVATPKIHLTTPTTFVPVAEGTVYAKLDDYRCFAIPNPHAGVKDFYLTGYDVNPGATAYVHHALAIPVDLDASTDLVNSAGVRATGVTQTGLVFDPNGTPLTNQQVIGLLTASDRSGRAGWPCFGTAGTGVSHASIPVVWAPGQGAVQNPAQSGARIGSEIDIFVVQIHYNLDNGHDAPVVLTNPVTPTDITLEVQETPPTRQAWFFMSDKFLASLLGPQQDVVVIPPASGDTTTFTYRWTATADEMLAQMGNPALTAGVNAFDIYGLFPHMHQRGVEQTISVHRANGDNVCGVHVNAWDFHWQLMYFRDQPIRMARGDTLEVSCTWNTEGATESILPGWGTENEMCLANIYAVLPAGN